MEARLAAFRAATHWLWPTGGCIVHEDPDPFCPARDLRSISALDFAGRLVVAATCRGEHDWERLQERWSPLRPHREIIWRCRRHPQHPVYRITPSVTE